MHKTAAFHGDGNLPSPPIDDHIDRLMQDVQEKLCACHAARETERREQEQAREQAEATAREGRSVLIDLALDEAKSSATLAASLSRMIAVSERLLRNPEAGLSAALRLDVTNQICSARLTLAAAGFGEEARR